jgi:hypothetical protein
MRSSGVATAIASAAHKTDEGNSLLYNTFGDAWRRLNDEQRLWVEEKNPRLAAEAAMAAIHSGTVAWH